MSGAVVIEQHLRRYWMESSGFHEYIHLMSEEDRTRIHEGETFTLNRAIEYIETALSGDEDASFSLVGMCHNSLRGDVVRLLYELNAPTPAYRAALESAWTTDHRHVIRAAENRRRLRSMFRRARFPLPDQLPDTVRIWRGTSALPFSQACKGFSWTVDRDCAAWFAMRFADKNGYPLVLAADVPKSAILLYTEGRGESEAVCFDAASPFVDGTRRNGKQFLNDTRNRYSAPAPMTPQAHNCAENAT